jgi:SAM-dependent methyltransferase
LQCSICKTEGDKITEHEYSEVIYTCPKCKVSFSEHIEAADYTDYESLYPGMKAWCEDLKYKPNAWRKIVDRGEPYAAIMQFFMNQDEKFKILDYGCGYGYIDYVLRGLGFDVYGVDISDQAIDFARKTYGDYYGKPWGDNLLRDIIIAIEVFEHLVNPKEWLQKCLTVAPKIIITTPNLDFYKKYWVSESPPIHFMCYRKETLEYIANELGIEVEIDNGGRNIIATFYAKS